MNKPQPDVTEVAQAEGLIRFLDGKMGSMIRTTTASPSNAAPRRKPETGWRIFMPPCEDDNVTYWPVEA